MVMVRFVQAKKPQWVGPNGPGQRSEGQVGSPGGGLAWLVATLALLVGVANPHPAGGRAVVVDIGFGTGARVEGARHLGESLRLLAVPSLVAPDLTTNESSAPP